MRQTEGECSDPSVCRAGMPREDEQGVNEHPHGSRKGGARPLLTQCTRKTELQELALLENALSIFCHALPSLSSWELLELSALGSSQGVGGEVSAINLPSEG